MTTFGDLEHMVKPRQAIVARPSSDETNRLTRRGENTLDSEEVVMWLSEEASSVVGFDWKSMGEQKKTSESVLEGLVEREKVPKMMEDGANHWMD